jgi:hypothetical protein
MACRYVVIWCQTGQEIERYYYLTMLRTVQDGVVILLPVAQSSEGEIPDVAGRQIERPVSRQNGMDRYKVRNSLVILIELS